MQELNTTAEQQVEGYLLSPQQKRLWKLRQRADAGVFRAQCIVELDGELSTAVLTEAVGRVVARHEILRTSFRRQPGMKVPVQVTSASARPELHRLESRATSAVARSAEVEAAAAREREGAFDLEGASLLRLRLLSFDPRVHALIVTLPALCADARTLRNFTAELSLAYAACLAGEEVDEEVTQYAQFAEWQSELLEGEGRDEGEEFWRQHRRDDAHATRLPFESDVRASEEFAPASLSVELEREFAARVGSAARQHGASAQSFLLACWQTMLWRLTGEAEVVVGCVYDGRKYDELLGGMGLLARAAPLRTRFAPDFSFGEILRRLDDAATEAGEWQEYFIWGDGTGGDFPAFGFEYDEPLPRYRAGGVTFTLTRAESYFERFKLKLSCVPEGDALRATFHYDSTLYERDDVARLAEGFLALTSDAAADARKPVGRLAALGAAERARLLVDFNNTARDYPRDKCLHECFEEQVARTPDATAVVFRDERLTYAELNARANRLARRLRALGVGADVLVGVYMHRSAELPVALLAVLKAGGAYVPLDPSYPRERLAYMLEDAGLGLVLTQGELREGLPDGAARVVELDGDTLDLASESAENLAPAATPENLAYVIYTSGSTGKPKGAMLPHRGVVNCVSWMQRTYRLGPDDRFLLKTSLNFDPSVWELFWPLWVGARVVVAEPWGHLDAAYLVKTIVEQKVTSVYFVPSLLAAVLEESRADECRSLRRVICGGESLSRATLGRFYEVWGQAELHHSYGPTETSIAASEWTCEPTYPRAVAPIGRPLGNTRIYVLDPELQPVPGGAAGELYVGGVALGRGYLNRPVLTAERFIPDPYSKEPGARLYRTGDLTRLLPGGELEFLGRVDNQVKVRGFRIELGEVEAALRRHTRVRECVVVARGDAAGDKRLVAYVVWAAGERETVGGLREFVRESLPDYMVPSEWGELDALPLTPGGKVDVRALPDVSELAPREGEEFVAPRDAVEEVLANIWAELLGVERVGARDNFFALGGHSLLATQVIARARAAFGVELPLTTLFERPTVEALAEDIAGRAGDGAVQAPPLVPTPREGATPLSFAQQRLWFLQQFDPSSNAYHIPLALRLHGALDAALLERALNEVVRRHESLRTNFAIVEGEPVQVIHPERPLTLEVCDLSGLPEAERSARVRELMADNTGRPFDLAHDMLLRALLLRLSEEDYVVAFTLHHIVSDGWSTGVFVGEVARLYAAFKKGRPSPLEPLPIQYADYAHWQREWLRDEVLEAQLDYWKGQLAEPPPSLGLLTDHTRPALLTYEGATREFGLPPSLTQALQALSRREGVTLFMTLLAAFKVLLARYAGQTDIVVGTPVAGRRGVETERLIGFFVNTLALRTDLSGDPSFTELLGRVRRTALGAYAHQDVPFEKLIEELNVPRSLSHHPLFQVMLTMNNTPASGAELPGLSLSPVETQTTTAKFDLSLTMMESGGRLLGALNYNTNLFEAETAERLIQHFQIMLESVTSDPSRRLSEFRLLTEEESYRQLVEWNDTGEELPLEQCLHHPFEHRAALTPSAPALFFEGSALTYAELDRRADLLAARLRSLGIGVDAVVGVHMERSVEMVVALYGILKAGGAYLPLEPTLPAERLSFMLTDAAPRVVLTQPHLRDSLPAHAVQVISLEAGWGAGEPDEAGGGDDAHAWEPPRPDSAAYVIYTSGSTGRPKGVVVSHRAIVNRLLWMQNAYHLTPSDRVMQKTPFGFDVSVWEFFWPLMTGAALVVARPEGHKDPAYIARLIESEAVTVMHFVPSMLSAFLDWMEEAGEAGRCATLRDVVCSGEALSRGLAAKFHELLPARLHNLYGPTEAAVDVTSWECERGGGEGASVPIGRPISNTRIYVLDAGLRLVLRGVAGELHIGGVALARGYLNRPGLTAERFIPDPYSTEPGARLYKTGDLARHRADGAVEFLGRIDNQVKLRGFRIELGEIEAVLREHDSVAEAVVVLREESPGDPRLVAYFVGEAAAEELRSHLQARLPDYMAPSAYVQLGALPLTASGKVDRRALPSHGGRRVSSGAAYAPPRTEAEQTIAALWREVLGVERVGVDDNFFDLGGHSLLLVRLVNKLRAAFTKEINVVDMFKYPTIHALADFLTLAEDEESSGEKTKDRASLRQASTRRWRQQRQQRRAAAAAQGEVDEVAD